MVRAKFVIFDPTEHSGFRPMGKGPDTKIHDFLTNDLECDIIGLGIELQVGGTMTTATNRSYAKRRQRTLDWLGNICVHCGFTDPRALQIDHRAGDGHIDRKTMTERERWEDIWMHPGRNQLLCANCNVIKRVENNEYFHGPRRPSPAEIRKSLRAFTIECVRHEPMLLTKLVQLISEARGVSVKTAYQAVADAAKKKQVKKEAIGPGNRKMVALVPTAA